MLFVFFIPPIRKNFINKCYSMASILYGLSVESLSLVSFRTGDKFFTTWAGFLLDYRAAVFVMLDLCIIFLMIYPEFRPAMDLTIKPYKFIKPDI